MRASTVNKEEALSVACGFCAVWPRSSCHSFVQVTFELTSKDLEYVGADLRPVIEGGVFLFGAGPAADCRANPETCVALTVTVSEDYQPACQVLGKLL